LTAGKYRRDKLEFNQGSWLTNADGNGERLWGSQGVKVEADSPVPGRPHELEDRVRNGRLASEVSLENDPPPDRDATSGSQGPQEPPPSSRGIGRIRENQVEGPQGPPVDEVLGSPAENDGAFLNAEIGDTSANGIRDPPVRFEKGGPTGATTQCLESESPAAGIGVQNLESLQVVTENAEEGLANSLRSRAHAPRRHAQPPAFQASRDDPEGTQGGTVCLTSDPG
jgi:hypothetical protein